MLCTTLGYLERNGSWLMLLRNKKKNDVNEGKWIGIGGKLEEGETPQECMIRETKEETGLIWHDPRLRGIITFNFRKHPKDPLFSELMFLFDGSDFEGTLHCCTEGELKWVPIQDVFSLPLWAGDICFLKILCQPFDSVFFMELNYLGDDLISGTLNGKPLTLPF